jgi:hypothetical protein
MIPLVILFATALAVGLCLLVWREYRLMRRGGARRRVRYRRHGKVIEMQPRRGSERDSGRIHIVIENEFCKDLQG